MTSLTRVGLWSDPLMVTHLPPAVISIFLKLLSNIAFPLKVFRLKIFVILLCCMLNACFTNLSLIIFTLQTLYFSPGHITHDKLERILAMLEGVNQKALRM